MNLSKDKVTEIFYFADNFCKELFKIELGFEHDYSEHDYSEHESHESNESIRVNSCDSCSTNKCDLGLW